MDILRTPLLDDDDRRRAFFEAMPELFFGELLNELKHNRYFSYNRIQTLENYDMLVSRDSFNFERKTYQEMYDEFKVSFDKLKSFTENNLFVENDVVLLQPILKVKEPEQYQGLEKELDTLCLEVVDKYKRLVTVFTKEKINREARTSVTWANNILRYDNEHYKIRSKKKQGLMRALWPKRVNKKGIKKAEWTNCANVAVSMGIIESARNFNNEVSTEMYSTIKDMNKYLGDIGFPVDIKKNKEGNLLIVVSS